MKFTIKQFNVAYNEVANYSDKDAYISDLALSSLFWEGDNPEKATPVEELVEPLSKIWDVAHMTIKDIRMTTGLSQVDFHRKFLIPIRTLQSWETETDSKRNCPGYVKLLLAAACRLIEFGE